MNATLAETPLPLQAFEPDPEVAYTIETVSHITRIPRHTIAVYCRHNLVTPLVDPDHGGWFFDDSAIRTLRRIEELRTTHGASLDAVALILGLMRQVESLEERLRFLRT